MIVDDSRHAAVRAQWLAPSSRYKIVSLSSAMSDCNKRAKLIVENEPSLRSTPHARWWSSGDVVHVQEPLSVLMADSASQDVRSDRQQ